MHLAYSQFGEKISKYWAYSLMVCFYVEKALPFGASVSCKTFEQFSSFLEFCVKSKMSSGKLIHYLDDFLGGDKSELGCRKVMDSFINCMHELNVPLATEKTEGPTEIIVFLGLE